MNTIIIINLIISCVLLIYLSVKIFLFKHRHEENLIRYDNEIYIKIDRLTFYEIKAAMIKHLSSDKKNHDEYTATLGVMKFIYSTDTTKAAAQKTQDRIINGITVDYINNQLEKISDKEISTKTDAIKLIDNQENISEENKHS